MPSTNDDSLHATNEAGPYFADKAEEFFRPLWRIYGRDKRAKTYRAMLRLLEEMHGESPKEENGNALP